MAVTRKKGGRTPGSRSGPTKDNLLEAVSRLMCQRPDADVTISEIAAEAGANSALIGYYFGNKNGLLMALLQRNTRGSFAELEAVMSSPILTAADKVKVHISGLVNLYYRFPYHNRLMSYLIEHSDSDHRSMIADDIMRPLIDLYARFLAEAERTGEFRRIDPMFFYFSLIGACERIFTGRHSMLMAFGITEVDKSLKQRFVEHTAELIIPGLLARHTAPAQTAASEAALLAKGVEKSPSLEGLS